MGDCYICDLEAERKRLQEMEAIRVQTELKMKEQQLQAEQARILAEKQAAEQRKKLEEDERQRKQAESVKLAEEERKKREAEFR